jgi:hypothetical protein
MLPRGTCAVLHPLDWQPASPPLLEVQQAAPTSTTGAAAGGGGCTFGLQQLRACTWNQLVVLSLPVHTAKDRVLHAVCTALLHS